MRTDFLVGTGVSYKRGAPLMVENAGDCLHVVGVNPFHAVDLDSWDIFEAYRKVPKEWSAGRTGKRSPHIQFANADTDEKLVAFVEQFGPVVASSVSETRRSPGDVRILSADQNWEELRNERLLFRSALILLTELERGEKADVSVLWRCMSDIATRCLVGRFSAHANRN